MNVSYAITSPQADEAICRDNPDRAFLHWRECNKSGEVSSQELNDKLDCKNRSVGSRESETSAASGSFQSIAFIPLRSLNGCNQPEAVTGPEHWVGCPWHGSW